MLIGLRRWFGTSYEERQWLFERHASGGVAIIPSRMNDATSTERLGANYATAKEAQNKSTARPDIHATAFWSLLTVFTVAFRNLMPFIRMSDE